MLRVLVSMLAGAAGGMAFWVVRDWWETRHWREDLTALIAEIEKGRRRWDP